MTNKFTYEAECESCKGSGLYVGFAERDGFAVVCSNCKGTGKIKETVEWKDFTGRKKRKNIDRVLEVNPGISVGKGNCKLEDFGGVPYRDWLKDGKFPPNSEMRKFTCPAWWYQSADYEKKPNWKECPGFGAFSSCPSFKTKHKCWEKFDKEK